MCWKLHINSLTIVYLHYGSKGVFATLICFFSPLIMVGYVDLLKTVHWLSLMQIKQVSLSLETCQDRTEHF